MKIRSFFKTFPFLLISLLVSPIYAEESRPDTPANPVEGESAFLFAKGKDPQPEPFEVALSADCEPLTTAAGCVNLITGCFFQVNQDLVTETIDPLVFNRFYDSGSFFESFLGFGCGSQYPLFISEAEKHTKNWYIGVSEREGFLIPYRTRESMLDDQYFVDPSLFHRGYTNFNQTKLTGQTNLINRRASLQPKKGWKIFSGDGSIRRYERGFTFEKGWQRQIGFPTSSMSLLTQENKSNGNTLYFDYDLSTGRPLLSKIWTVSRSKQAVLNTFTFTHSKEGCVLKSTCGNTIAYSQSPRLVTSPLGAHTQRMLRCVRSCLEGEITYTLSSLERPLITKIDKPRSCYLDIRYDGKARVKALLEPLGKE